jgi:ribonuclease HI
MEKLYFRKVVNDPLCPICRLEVESCAHVIWRCPASIAVWSECNRSIQKCVVADGAFLSIFEHLNFRLNVADLGLVSVIAQKIWLRRNKMIFGGPVMPPTCLIKYAEDVLKDFNLAKGTGRDNLQVSCPKQSKWQKPPQGMLKLNWDAAVDKGSKIMGVGIIIRDHNGEVCASSCSTRPYVVNPSVAEALGARQGVELCIELGIQSILLEGDAKEIVNAIAKGGVSLGCCGSIIDHTRSLLTQVHFWAVQHVPRKFNAAAHKLARFAIDQRQHRVWRDSFPLFLEANVLADKLEFLSCF